MCAGNLATHGVLSPLHFAPRREARDFPVHVGRALVDRPAQLPTRSCATITGQELPDSDPAGAAHHRHDLGPKVLPCRCRRCSSSAARPGGRRGSASYCRTRPRSSTISRIINSLNTEAINHDPATTFIQTGASNRAGPAWAHGSATAWAARTRTCPAFVVMISQGSGNKTDQPFFSRLWGTGFFPVEHQGVRFRSGDDPVLYLSNPPGVDAAIAAAHARRRGRIEQAWRPVVRRSRDQHPHRAIRDGLPHAIVACPS